MKFTLEIITPKGIYFTKEVDSLTVKLSSGYRTFLSRHTPLIGTVEYAPMHIIIDKKTYYYAVHGGAINVKKEKIILVVNAIESAKDIDSSRAKAAKERAEKRLKNKDPNLDVKRAELALARAITRLKTFENN